MDFEEYKKIKKEPIDGYPADFIDLESARTDAIDVETFKPQPKAAEKAGGGDDVDFEVPDGWKEMQRTPQRMFRYGFRVGDGANTAEVTLTPFPGAAGGVGANVNRWREELGLQALPLDQAKNEGRTITVDAIKAVYVDYSGMSQRSGRPARTLGVICPHDDEAWFIKMMGAPELVAREQAAFESFVKSIRFGGGK